MNICYSDGRTDLKLRCDCSIKFHLLKGAQDVTRLTAVCCMLLPHDPYRLSQHYKRHVCEPNCEHRYLCISPIFEHYFCLNYMGTVCHLQPFWSQEFSLHRPVLIFQLTVNSRASDNQSKQSQNLISQLEKNVELLSVYVYIDVCGEGIFWHLNESPTFKGPAA